MNVDKNTWVHFRVKVINHAWLRYHVIVLSRFNGSKKVVVWIQLLVLQAVNSNNRVDDVNINPVQRRLFGERFSSILGWIKNFLVVAKVEKLVFHPLANFLFRLASFSNCWIASFEKQQKDFRGSSIPIPLDLQWFVNASHRVHDSFVNWKVFFGGKREPIVSFCCVNSKICCRAVPCWHFKYSIAFTCWRPLFVECFHGTVVLI